MKVVQINCVYGRGSTGELTRDLHRALLAAGENALAFYGRGESSPDPGAVRVGGELRGKLNGARAKLSGVMYGGCEIGTAALLSRLRAEKPDVVHLQCVNGNFVNLFRLVSFLKREELPTVLTLHAEFMFTANCSHAFDCDKWLTGCGACPDLRNQTHSLLADRTASSWKRMAEAFDGFRDLTVVPVSPWLEERARRSPFFRQAKFRTILNGVDTGIFRPAEGKERENVRRVLYVTPHFTTRAGHVKGGEFLYPLAERLGEAVRIRAVGPGDWGTPPSNVELLGPIRDRRELARLYAESDLTLLTSRRETFSMVAAESLCCGTPVAGFRAGGPESIAVPEFSRFCEPGDVGALAETVLRLPLPNPQTVACAAAARYAKEKTVREYLDIYQKVRKRT